MTELILEEVKQSKPPFTRLSFNYYDVYLVIFCQIKVLDMLNQERVAAERRDVIYRIEQQATQGREEARITQVSQLLLSTVVLTTFYLKISYAHPL